MHTRKNKKIFIEVNVLRFPRKFHPIVKNYIGIDRTLMPVLYSMSTLSFLMMCIRLIRLMVNRATTRRRMKISTQDQRYVFILLYFNRRVKLPRKTEHIGTGEEFPIFSRAHPRRDLG